MPSSSGPFRATAAEGSIRSDEPSDTFAAGPRRASLQRDPAEHAAGRVSRQLQKHKNPA
jgi:hypothetical protein